MDMNDRKSSENDKTDKFKILETHQIRQDIAYGYMREDIDALKAAVRHLEKQIDKYDKYLMRLNIDILVIAILIIVLIFAIRPYFV